MTKQTRNRTSLLVVIIFIIISGYFLFIRKDEGNLYYIEDTEFSYKIATPEDLIDSSESERTRNIYFTDGSISQYTLRDFPFESAESSPFFQIRVFEENDELFTAGISSITNYFNNNLRDNFPEEIKTKEENRSNIHWYIVCSTEDNPSKCGAYTRVPAGGLLEILYNTQETVTAIPRFYSAFNYLIDNFLFL